jgi:hypothetical protein
VGTSENVTKVSMVTNVHVAYVPVGTTTTTTTTTMHNKEPQKSFYSL